MAEQAPVFRARIALLMATRNQASSLPQALGSLLAQTHLQFTLTIVNDGSDDNSADILASYQNDNRVQIISTRPQGLIAGLNLAMQKSKPAAFYAIVYASCFYSPNYLELMLKELQKQPRAVGAFSNFCQGTSQGIHKLLQEPFFSQNELLVRNFLGPGVLFRSEAFQQAGAIFLSERKGIWETWQRMAQKGIFVSVPKKIIRWQPHLYESAPRYKVDIDKEVIPHLHVQIMQLEDDPVDFDLLNLLHQAGHKLIQTLESFQAYPPDLILCNSPERLQLAFERAKAYYAPILFVINDVEILQGMLRHPKMRFLLGACQIMTRTLKVAQWLKQQYQYQTIVYMNGMTSRETSRLLARVPMVLHRQKACILIRAYGHPKALEKTLLSLRDLNHPPEFGEVVIFCVDSNPTLLNWLKSKPYTWFSATQNNYFPQLLALLKQVKASYVLHLDSGLVPAADYFTSVWPVLADPRIAMVGGHINHGPEAQALPFNVKNILELSQQWPQYHPNQPYTTSRFLSDSAFLIRKPVFEWALESFPDTLPLADETLFSRLLNQAGYGHVLCRKTVAFNLWHTL